MKTFTSLLLILFCCSINSYAAEIKFIAEDNKSTTKICMAAVTNNTKVMIGNLRMLSLRGSALSYRTLINSIQCNKQYIGNFAKTYDAQNTFAYLDQFTNKRNKKRQTNITIKKVANEQGENNEKTIVVLVGSN
jgi:hypothetical protein